MGTNPKDVAVIPDELQPVLQHVNRCIAAFQDPKNQKTEFELPFELSKKQRHIVHSYITDRCKFYSKSYPKQWGNEQLKVMKIFKEDPQLKQDSGNNLPTESQVETFANLTRVPFPCHSPQLVEYYVEAFDDFYNTKEMWDLYQEEQGIIPNFKQESSAAMQKIAEAIQTHPQYMSMKTKTLPPVEVRKKDSVYNFSNVGKTFVSMDIRKGNFTMLKRACPELFQDDLGRSISWEEFVGQFTDSKFLAKSKYFREVCFGRSNFSKRATALQEQFMDEVHQEVISVASNGDTIPDALLSLEMKVGDELVYEVPSHEALEATCGPALRKALLDKFGDTLHFHVFTLDSIEGKPYFTKTFTYNSDWYNDKDDKETHDNNQRSPIPIASKVEFKCVPRKFMIQVLKRYKKEPICKRDLYFMDEGMLCQYCHSIFENAPSII